MSKKSPIGAGLFHFERPATDWTPSMPPPLCEGEAVGIDFEYRGDRSAIKAKPFALAVYSHDRDQGWYLPWGHEGGGNLPFEQVKTWVESEVRNRDVSGLNTKAEVHCLRHMGIDVDRMNNRWHDVAFNAALLNENRYSGFSLEALDKEYLPEHERKVNVEGLDPDKFWIGHAGEVANRCVSDARQAQLIHKATYDKILQECLERVERLEGDCILATVESERNGALLDRPKLERWSSLLDERITQLFMETHRETGIACNPNKGMEMARLFNSLGLQKPVMYDEKLRSDQESWGADALKTVDHPTVQRVMKLKKFMSMKSKYIDKYLNAMDSDNRIFFQLHQMRGDENGTVTGRYSCGGGKWAINIQQVMKAEKQIEEFGDEFIIRELFIAELGRLVGASDASQIEFRLFGHYSKSPFIVQAYADDPWVDFHMMVTVLMNPGVTAKDKLKALRKHMKHNNFGVLYGMGRPKLARKLGLPCSCLVDWNEKNDDGRKVRYFGRNKFHNPNCLARQANDIMDEYEAKFPQAHEMLEKASDVAKERGYVYTLLGRRRRYPQQQRLHSALNAVIQGGAADLFKLASVALYRERKSLDITMRMPVHDEWVYDCDEPNVKRIDEFFNDQRFPLSVPILWETGTGQNWKQANGQ